MEAELVSMLEKASEKLGRLDGMTVNLPSLDLFVAMFVRKEAVLSSQIEGTQASLDDIIVYELTPPKRYMPADVAETVNYVKAMNYGLNRVSELPLSLRLMREIHERLLEDTRGSHRTPGEFRRSQNWIGPPGCDLANATFIPPPPDEMVIAMGELEKFLHEDVSIPILINAAIAHAQFETIHPFLDGNGRIGRLLITFTLCHKGVLKSPLLYLSYFFKANRSSYYEHLNRIRTDGDWESWVTFFLRGIAEVSETATDTAKTILKMRSEHIDLVRKTFPRAAANALKLLDLLFTIPGVTASELAKRIEVSRPTAYSLISKFQRLGILNEHIRSPWGSIFYYDSYLNILKEGTQLSK